MLTIYRDFMKTFIYKHQSFSYCPSTIRESHLHHNCCPELAIPHPEHFQAAFNYQLNVDLSRSTAFVLDGASEKVVQRRLRKMKILRLIHSKSFNMKVLLVDFSIVVMGSIAYVVIAPDFAYSEDGVATFGKMMRLKLICTPLLSDDIHPRLIASFYENDHDINSRHFMKSYVATLSP